MKKYLLIIFLFLLIMFLYRNSSREVEDVFLYDSNLIYNDYILDVDITLKKYIDVFKVLDDKEYIIKDINIIHNYNTNISEEISNIRIVNGNYKDSINGYIDKYIEILDKYNLDSEISKIYGGNFKIDRIVVYTSKDIYRKIKELFVR